MNNANRDNASVTKPANATVQPANQSANANSSQPTAQSMFGPEPWVKDPWGMELTTGQRYNYNPYYFATPEAAQKVAEYVGGKVEASSGGLVPFGPFSQSHPNLMIKMPDTRNEDGEITKVGIVFNAGLFMSIWDHKWSQSFIDDFVRRELEG